MHATEDDVLRVGTSGRVAGQLEGISCDVGESDDLVTLVVVSEHEHPFAEGKLCCGGPGHEVGVGRRREAAGAFDTALGVRVSVLPEHEQGKRPCRRGHLAPRVRCRATWEPKSRRLVVPVFRSPVVELVETTTYPVVEPVETTTVTPEIRGCDFDRLNHRVSVLPGAST